MSEGSEKPKFQPPEAHPEPPLSKGPLLNQLHELAGKPPSTRRTLLKGAIGLGMTAIGTKKVREELNRPSSAHGEGGTPEINNGPEVISGPSVIFLEENEEGKYILSNVAQSVEDFPGTHTRDGLDDQGKPVTFKPKMHKYKSAETFSTDPSYTVNASSEVPENIEVVRIGLPENNEWPEKRYMDPDGNDLFVWYAYRDKETHQWTDEDGNPSTDEITVFSPIFADYKE